MSPKLETPS